MGNSVVTIEIHLAIIMFQALDLEKYRYGTSTIATGFFQFFHFLNYCVFAMPELSVVGLCFKIIFK